MSESLAVHHTREPHPDTSAPDPHQDKFSMTYMGFWVYLMTDCILFATLFITYAVLHGNTFGGPSSKDLFELPLAFAETLILLFSSLTCGLALLEAVKKRTRHVIGWLLTTFVL